MRKQKERLMLATITKNIETKTRKLTSRTAFFNDMVTRHSDGIWDHQKKWLHENVLISKEKKTNRIERFWKKKSDEIRKRNREEQHMSSGRYHILQQNTD